MERHIEHIYQAAVAPDMWRVFLEDLRKELSTKTLHLSFRLPCGGDPGILLSLGMEERFEDAYRSHFHLMDPWMPFLGVEREGDTRGLEEFVPESRLARTEFYNDWMRPQDIFYGFGAFLKKSGPSELVSSLSGFREKGRGPFRREDLERIRGLVPHLQRALVIHSRLQGAEMRAGAAAEALDRISGGVILLDERGVPVTTNRTADQILAMSDGLVLERGGPSASTSSQTGELRALISEAAATGTGEGTKAGGVLWLERPSGHTPLEVVVTPIHRKSPVLCDRVAAAILVTDPDARAARPPERLRRIYDLTAMEAEVASRLVKGMRISEIAEEFEVTVHTIRGHLKQLFAKTGTHRQADLIRELLAGPARLRLD